MSSINDPKHWRDRAEQMRVLAGQMHDSESRRTMLTIVEEYEKLAARAEIRLGQQRPPQTPPQAK
jgi:hypothetical protein